MARLVTRDRRFSNFFEAALTACLSDLTSFSESLYSLVAFCSLDLYDLESVWMLVKSRDFFGMTHHMFLQVDHDLRV